jgi:uncharacterized phage protein (TIGR01671 family)
MNNREIKFRYWDEAHKVFLYSDAYESFWLCFPDMIKNNPQNIQQYTDINDKNGYEIYEGDIVNIEEHSLYHSRVDIHKVVVVFKDGSFVGRDSGAYFLSLGGQEVGLNVIGNIFENPELIK